MPTAAFVVNRNRIRHFPRLQHRSATAAAARGWEIEVLETRSADAGDGATRQAVAAGAQLVFAVGGDGTVRACAQALAGTGTPLAIVPLGTANLTARTLGIPGRADRAIDAGFRGRDRVIDLALAEQAGAGGIDPALADQGGAGGIGFTAMAGIGLDAAVVEAARIRLRPILMTSFAFILGVFPLVIATGAGAGARRSIGLAVFSGMIASTCLVVVFVPSFYVVMQRIQERWIGRAARLPTEQTELEK